MFNTSKKKRLFDIRVLFGIIIFLLLLSSIITFNHTLTTTSASGQYLLEGLRYHKGLSPQKIDRGPIYPILLAGSFFMRGPSIASAFVVTQLFYVLCIMLLFILAFQLYDKWVAFVSSFLIIFSLTLYIESRTINLDFVLATFLLLFLILFIRAIRKNKLLCFIFSGVVLALAYLTSEIGLLYLPFPILTVILLKKYRSQHYFASILLLYVAFLIVVLPWAIYLYLHDIKLIELLGVLSPLRSTGDIFFGSKGLMDILIQNDPIRGLIRFWKSFMIQGFVVWPLMLGGWLYIALRWFRDHKESDSLVMLSGLMYAPMLTAMGWQGDRLGHAVLFVCYCYITLGVAVAVIVRVWPSISAKYVQRIGVRKVIFASVTCIFFVCIVLGILSYRYTNWRKLERIFASVKDINPVWNDFKVIGRHNRDIELASQWLVENVPVQSVILTDGMFDDAFRWFTHLKFRIVSRNLPAFHISHVFTRSHQGDISGQRKHIIAVTTIPSKFRSTYYRYRIVFLIFEKDWKDYQEKVLTKDRYVVICENTKVEFPFVVKYLKTSPWCRLVYSKKPIDIFKIESNRPSDSIEIQKKCFTSPWVKEDLAWLKENYEKEYEQIEILLKEGGCSGILL